MSKKSVFIIISIVLEAVILVCGALFIPNIIESKKASDLIDSSEITLSNEESDAFKAYFGIDKPDYLSVLECAEGKSESDSYIAVKAVILRKNIDTLISEMGEANGSELYQNNFRREPIEVSFDNNIDWWNIEEGRHIASYTLYLDSHKNGASAITVVRVGGVNYVYMWYADPAMIAK